jgi:hypothetical protein
MLVIDEKYDGVTNHQVVVALCGRLGGNGPSFVLYFNFFAMDAFHLFQKRQKKWFKINKINNLLMKVVQDPFPKLLSNQKMKSVLLDPH